MRNRKDSRRKRGLVPSVSSLECRRLLSEAAVWYGQNDGKDYTSANAIGSNGYQDIHIGLTGLLPYHIQEIDLVPRGGGHGAVFKDDNSGNAQLIRATDTTSTADLYTDCESPLNQTNLVFDTFTIIYSNGIHDTGAPFSTPSTTAALKSTPNLRVAGSELGVTWVGQNGDWVGPGPSVGPDGFADLHFHLTNLSAYPNSSYGQNFFNSQLDSVLVWGVTTGGQTVYWQSGLNAQGFNNAEVFVDPSSYDATKHTDSADLYLSPIAMVNGVSQPVTGLAGQALHVQVTYFDGEANGYTDVSPNPANPNAPAGATFGTYTASLAIDPTGGGANPTPATMQPLTAQWNGQDSSGAAHILLSGLNLIQPSQSYSKIVSASLSDDVGTVWQYPSAGGNPWALSLSAGADQTYANLGFNPDRNESGSHLMLRVVFEDPTTHVQTTAFAAVAGGTTDPSLWGPKVTNTTAVNVSPGADNALQTAVNNNPNGTIYLTAGNYVMTQTLDLPNPITINAAPGVTVTFSDPTGASWTNAITIHSGHTTLNGFTIQFDPTNKNNRANWKAPQNVIGLGNSVPISGLMIENMHINGPLSSGVIKNTVTAAPGIWHEEANSLLSLGGPSSGSIVNNVFKGGYLDFQGGPWVITGNDHQGAQPDTFAQAAFRFVYTHDINVQQNTVENQGSLSSPPTSGQMARSFFLNSYGYNDVIKGNTVMDGVHWQGSLPGDNAPENILTETAYLSEFEGQASRVLQNGYVLWIPPIGGLSQQRGGPIQAGDVVAVISGDATPSGGAQSMKAGSWVRIAQVIDAAHGVYLLDAPLSTNTSAYKISITRGYVNLTIDNNTINLPTQITPGYHYTGIVLGGSQFGTQVINNHITGGNEGFSLGSGSNTQGFSGTSAYAPTSLAEAEQNGWTYLPDFGMTINNNVIKDSLHGGSLVVGYGNYSKTPQGRTYLTATFNSNEVLWDLSWLNGLSGAIPGTFNIGTGNGTSYIASDPTNGGAKVTLAPDPRAIVVTGAGNWYSKPAGSTISTAFGIEYATLNNTPYTGPGSITDPLVWSNLPPSTGAIYKFDFGPSSSPVAAGYIGEDFTGYSPTIGYGWNAASPTSVTNTLDQGAGMGTDLTRDEFYTQDATFKVDLPNGSYNVTLTMGDVGNFAHEANVYFQGSQVSTIATTGGQIIAPTFLVTVTNGQLQLRLQEVTGPGLAGYAVIQGLTIIPAQMMRFDFGPSSSPVAAGYIGEDFTGYSPAIGYGWNPATVTSVTGTLDQGASMGTDLTRDEFYTQDATFYVDLPNGTYYLNLTMGDVGNFAHGANVYLQGTQVSTITTAAGQIVTPTFLAKVSNGQLQLRLQEVTGSGLAGYAVIQGLTISPAQAIQFDFGPSGSPIAAGYGGEGYTGYSSSLGYGWNAASNTSVTGTLDQGAGMGTDLTRDEFYTQDATFYVDVPNGTYLLSLTMGDVGNFAHKANVFLQGTQVGTIATAAGQIVTPSYRVTVSNGQLQLRLQQVTGAGLAGYAVIQGLTLSRV
ncbi:hypothetical protein [Singulisphaera sp. PoT]|uniref:hypothetical protein n=1 Tax=Singulisphaera sp. PoT TaxID=3411797 RepID=UPI003BF4EBBA